jgi:hypothetical protein
MKKVLAMSLFVMAICASGAFAQKQSTAASAESAQVGQKSSAPPQAISDRSSKGSTSSAGSSGNQSSTGQRTSTSGSPTVNLPSTQNATKTGEQSKTPPQAINNSNRKP